MLYFYGYVTVDDIGVKPLFHVSFLSYTCIIDASVHYWLRQLSSDQIGANHIAKSSCDDIRVRNSPMIRSRS